MACPECGGLERRAIGFNSFECTSQVPVVMRTWAPRPGYLPGPGVPMEPVEWTEYKVCGQQYSEGAVPAGTPTCACGRFAVGLCITCGQAVCGRESCHVEIRGRLFCNDHGRAAAEEAKRNALADAGFVIDVTDQTFNAEVIERSQAVPVVLDLWADWCAPCKQLSPILRTLAAEANRGFVLARVDIEANPQVRSLLNLSSIPMVEAFFKGRRLAGFTGALPEDQVRQWMDTTVRGS